MNTTFQNSAQVLSIGIFFSLMIVGLSTGLPASLYHGLVSQGVPQAAADKVAHLPPVSTLFAAFLGLNPVQNLLGPQVLAHVTPAQAQVLTGHSFFPSLIAGPFQQGLHAAFDFAIVACLIGAATSWTRGKRYVHDAGPDVAPSVCASVGSVSASVGGAAAVAPVGGAGTVAPVGGAVAGAGAAGSGAAVAGAGPTVGGGTVEETPELVPTAAMVTAQEVTR